MSEYAEMADGPIEATRPAPKTSDYYQSCVVLWPDGRRRAGNVAHVNMDSVERARAKLAAGKLAWVRAEDVEAVTSGVDVHG